MPYIGRGVVYTKRQETENGISRVQIPFHPDSLPTVETILSSVPEMNREDAEVLLEQVQAEFLDQCLDVNAVAGDASRDTVAMSRWFEERGIPQERIVAAFQRLEHRRATRGSPSQVQQVDGHHDRAARAAAAEAETEASWSPSESTGVAGAESEALNLRSLLFHIAEDQARRDGYIHRGVTCNSCHTKPIRGVRWRCANCLDFDLCTDCEATDRLHPKTHIFYKVKIPAPYLGSPRQGQEVLYPGKPEKMPHQAPWNLKSALSKGLNYDLSEFDALWDQFTCLANAKFEDDPNNIGWAIDRRAFDKTFVPHYSTHAPPPTSSMTFMRGLACVHSKTSNSRLREVFNGYDIDADGFVSRKDFLRMFRAYYAITKDITRDFIAVQEEELAAAGALDTIMSAQPLSSAFTDHPIIPGQHNTPWSKVPDAFGDLRPTDASDVVVRSDGKDEGDRGTIIANAKQYHENHPVAVDGTPSEMTLSCGVRRDFYLDEEGGLERSDEFDLLAEDKDVDQRPGLAEQAGTDLRSALTRRQSSGSQTALSRSSSRVRFQDHPEFDHHSNGSTSSRPVGERWGGYEIPQPEKDLGREILYQVTQEAFNEMLDPIFKAAEDLAIEVESTKLERKRWAERIAEVARKQQVAQRHSEAAVKDPLLAIAAAAEKQLSDAALGTASPAPPAHNGDDSTEQLFEAQLPADRYLNERTTMTGLMQSAHALAAQGVADAEDQPIEDSSFLDPEILEKPLEQLLDDSGYIVASERPASLRLDETTLVPSFVLEDPTWGPPPAPQGFWVTSLARDPTLPQNMPSGFPPRPFRNPSVYHYEPWDFNTLELPIRILEFPNGNISSRSRSYQQSLMHRIRALAVLANVDAIASSPLTSRDREIWPTKLCEQDQSRQEDLMPYFYPASAEQLRFVFETLDFPGPAVRALRLAIEGGYAQPLDLEIAEFRRRNLLDTPPTEARLERLAFLDKAEEEIKKRGGRGGRLSFEEFEQAIEAADGRLGFVESWLDMGSF
ncbi:hypothetical protein H2199_003855 [Coniosporium tulheliwenetii]|uniref:Uncharacterized protein n=1 Tax=Coniosporium tulheliwenetii TaxID=3383036 RepID=A0ACC2Z8L8_9PEZI|nr:hypothetical protein H2199_003855 [Cladosporium sp. JES 115]